MNDSHCHYTNLVFEGGGVRGTVYIGAIQALEELEIMPQITRLAGSSAGSLIAACVCMGYTSAELKSMITKNWPKLELPRWIDIGIRIAKSKGIIPVNSLRHCAQQLIEFKGHSSTITLRQLYTKTQKDLVIVATNLNTRKLEYFHHTHYPDTLLVDAIVCSMAIPFFFTPPILAKGAHFADPGLFCSNYPIWIFNSPEQLETGNFIRSLHVSKNTLGIRVQLSSEIDLPGENVFHPIRSISDYFYAVFATMSKNLDSIESSPEINRQSITIISDLPALVVPSENDTNLMISAGYVAAKLYFSNLETTQTAKRRAKKESTFQKTREVSKSTVEPRF
jgi:predicted acylesterase/phospholipase RssA